jgi:3-oxoacyl-[acyl-carrier-protein] synthase-1
MTLNGFNALGALSHDPCVPFSQNRAGTNIGEGGALLLLERDSDAPLAWLEGVGESSDAYHVSAPHPEGLGARLAMERALAEARCAPADIHHINAHGTGTKANDVVESKAIAELFGREVPVVSTKGYIGHTLGAAGACEAVFALLTLVHGWVPPSVGADPLDPKVEVHVPTARIDGTYRRVLSNSFAFGGNNISVLLRAA